MDSSRSTIIPSALWWFSTFASTHQHIIQQPTIPNPSTIKYYIPSYNKTSLEEWFTPPPTSSPGSKIVRSRGVVGAYIRLFHHLGRHRFFIIFPTPFLIDFGSIFAPKMAPKPIKNPFKSVQKLDRKTFYFGGRFFFDF